MHERYMEIQQRIELAGKFGGWGVTLLLSAGVKWQTALEPHFRNQVSRKWTIVANEVSSVFITHESMNLKLQVMKPFWVCYKYRTLFLFQGFKNYSFKLKIYKVCKINEISFFNSILLSPTLLGNIMEKNDRFSLDVVNLHLLVNLLRWKSWNGLNSFFPGFLSAGPASCF